MSEWATYTISEACKRFSSGKGIAASQIFEIGAYPVFGGNGIRGYTDTYNFEGECAIIGRQGAYCGNTKYFCGKAYMTEHAIVATANDEHNIGYIANLLSMMNLGQYQGQSAQPGLSVNTLSNIELKLPDKETQDSIFSLLSALDKKIALNKQINARLEEIAKTLYDYWFVQFDFPDANGKPYKSSGGEMVFDETLKREIPKGWEVKSLGEIVNFKNGINYSSDDVGDSVSYIVNVRDVSNSSIFIHEDDLDIVNLQGDKLQAYQIKENTILVARSGNPGATRLLVNTNKLVVYCGFIIAAEPKESNLLNLLFWFLKNQEERISDISAGTVLKNVSQDVLKRGCIVIPDKFILNKFNEFNRNIFAEISSMIKQNHQLTQLRDFLLPMLMNGQVSVAE